MLTLETNLKGSEEEKKKDAEYEISWLYLIPEDTVETWLMFQAIVHINLSQIRNTVINDYFKIVFPVQANGDG